jgi:hypothetical protein
MMGSFCCFGFGDWRFGGFEIAESEPRRESCATRLLWRGGGTYRFSGSFVADLANRSSKSK